MPAKIVTAAPVYCYHGTAAGADDSRLKRILKEGLNPSPKIKTFTNPNPSSNDQHARELATYGGVYFAYNVRDTTKYMLMSHQQIGGDYVLVVARIETRSPAAAPDEDVFGAADKNLLDEWLRKERGYMLTDYSAAGVLMDQDFPWDKAAREVLEGLAQWWDLRPQQLDALSVEFRNLLALNVQYQLLRGYGDGTKGYLSGDVYAWYQQATPEQKDIRQVLQRYRQVHDHLLRRFKALVEKPARGFRGEYHTFRVTEPVAYSGANRIVAVVRIHEPEDALKGPYYKIATVVYRTAAGLEPVKAAMKLLLERWSQDMRWTDRDGTVLYDQARKVEKAAGVRQHPDPSSGFGDLTEYTLVAVEGGGRSSWKVHGVVLTEALRYPLGDGVTTAYLVDRWGQERYLWTPAAGWEQHEMGNRRENSPGKIASTRQAGPLDDLDSVAEPTEEPTAEPDPAKTWEQHRSPIRDQLGYPGPEYFNQLKLKQPKPDMPYGSSSLGYDVIGTYQADFPLEGPGPYWFRAHISPENTLLSESLTPAVEQTPGKKLAAVLPGPREPLRRFIVAWYGVLYRAQRQRGGSAPDVCLEPRLDADQAAERLLVASERLADTTARLPRGTLQRDLTAVLNSAADILDQRGITAGQFCLDFQEVDAMVWQAKTCLSKLDHNQRERVSKMNRTAEVSPAKLLQSVHQGAHQVALLWTLLLQRPSQKTDQYEYLDMRAAESSLSRLVEILHNLEQMWDRTVKQTEFISPVLYEQLAAFKRLRNNTIKVVEYGMAGSADEFRLVRRAIKTLILAFKEFGDEAARLAQQFGQDEAPRKQKHAAKTASIWARLRD
jgi:hypothetical protein